MGIVQILGLMACPMIEIEDLCLCIFFLVFKEVYDNIEKVFQLLMVFVGLAYQGKDIVLRFIIEYSSLKDFGP
jgi:hypothetical protein